MMMVLTGETSASLSLNFIVCRLQTTCAASERRHNAKSHVGT